MPLPKSPYPRGELAGTVRRMFLGQKGPRAQPCELILSKRSASLHLVFVGDILPLLFRRVAFEPDVLELFADADLVVGNLEGVVTDRPWFPFLQKHSPDILDALQLLAPLPRWILNLANNHAGDYGPLDFSRTAALIDRRGARFVGTTEKPRLILAPNVTLTSWTEWSNHPAPWVQTHNPGAPESPDLHIAYPHFGHEFEREPRPDRGPPDGYELVVGHHPHFPQPIMRRRNQLVAWSLGNFLTEVRLPTMGEGLVARVGIATDGHAAVTSCRAMPIFIDRSKENVVVVRLSPMR
ncbi:MAG: CapA family protein [Deltaproteobacteria bacterium]|nr:CapA family protein [Deltaproteobacteria bacterium]